jgi:hypothetical protein
MGGREGRGVCVCQVAVSLVTGEVEWGKKEPQKGRRATEGEADTRSEALNGGREEQYFSPEAPPGFLSPSRSSTCLFSFPVSSLRYWS